MVEAAGIEPDHPQSTNRLVAHGFCRKALIPCRLLPSIESPGAPSRSAGVDPSRGGILETATITSPVLLRSLGVSERPRKNLGLGYGVIKCILGLFRGPLEHPRI